MFSHVMIGSNNIERAKEFYTLLFRELEAKGPFKDVSSNGQTRYFFQKDDTFFFITEPLNGEPATVANGGTIGLKCSSPEQVTLFHKIATENGALSIEDPPGERSIPLGKMYLAYIRDLDGHKICAFYA